MSSTKGSGAARPWPQGRNPQNRKAKKTVTKAQGRPVAHKKRAKWSGLDDRGKPGGETSADRKQPQVPFVVCPNSSHPDCEPGTFDAAALLKSVLAAVEPRLEEGLQRLEQNLSTGQGAAGDQPALQQDNLRVVGRQIAEALRAGVIEGMRTRERHLAQLVVIDRAAAQSKVLSQLHLRLFNLADGTGAEPVEETVADAFELVTPAYVDADSGRVIERGWARKAPAPGASLPQGKAHGRVSRQHKDKQDGGDSELRRSAPGPGSLLRTAGQSVAGKGAAPQQPPVREALVPSAETTASTTPAESHDRSDPKERSDSDGEGHGLDARDGTAAHHTGTKETEPGQGQSAPLIPASFLIRRLLGGVAEEGQSQRRSS
jgi:hypothetical protein